MRIVIVSHTHWDREWYRTFQAFRARLVDTVDRLLELIEEDPDYTFQLDGQSIVIEDYLEVRPQNREAFEQACRAGRIAVGPWYVQPDSLLPSGESHIRNLLEGRRVAEAYGGSSRIAYTPDSFGHPAQFPALFAGFGLDPFIYWRGNASELDDLPAEYEWRSPSGAAVRACHLGKGYFCAWGFGDDVEAASKRLEGVATELAEKATSQSVLLMNGLDHMLPDANTREVAEALAKRTGWEVTRGLLDDFADSLQPLAASFTGELIGGRTAPLLPGVWSTRTPLKRWNRRCEATLEHWAEPFAALSSALGGPDESASLRSAWRSLLPNQAHDSICGCSQDRVHEQMVYRYENAHELALETTQRSLERIAGLGVDRQDLASPSLEIAVFNPSPHPRTEVVRLPLEGYPAFSSRGVNALLAANRRVEGFEVDGEPARVVPHDGRIRPDFAAGRPVHDLEFLARDVPAFGYRRFALSPSPATSDIEDDGREISNDGVCVEAALDGTLTLRFGEGSACREYAGIGGLEDIGDRGDTYDFDPVTAGPALEVSTVEVSRSRHPSGLQHLRVRRSISVPAELAQRRDQRSKETVQMDLLLEARIAPGIDRVDVRVHLDNRARDHRLRLLFPSADSRRAGPDSQGAAGQQQGHEGIDRFEAATTLDACERSTEARDDSSWIHPAPETFPQQGWVRARELTVAAPGLPEAQVFADGTIAITLVRSVGWLSRGDLETRPGEAGPWLNTPGAQCLEVIDAQFSLFIDGSAAPKPTGGPSDQRPNGGSAARANGGSAARARDAERGMWAVAAGRTPLLDEGRSLLSVEPRAVDLSALKPAEDGNGMIARIVNPTARAEDVEIAFGFAVAAVTEVGLDETRETASGQGAIDYRDGRLSFPLAPHEIRSIRIQPA